MNKINKQNVTFLKDYSSPNFLIDHADLEFTLDPEKTLVKSALKIRRNPNTKSKNSSITFNGVNLALEEIKINKEKLQPEDYQVTNETLTIKKAPDDFLFETAVRISPANNLTCSGLYLTDGNFCTQNEPTGFRNLTYFIDRPDILTTFKTTIIADQKKYPTLLSNGNLISKNKLKNGNHEAVWEDPFPKSAYLFALVAGNYSYIEDQFITKSNRKITLRIYTESKQLDQCNHAMESLKQAMKWEEDKFDLEYDLDLYQIVAVNDFNFGAMENKGLNIFNSNLLLASPLTATDEDFRRITSVIGHEYFHNWTGNRVTCRDWFQIGLKEGLTTLREQLFMEDTYGQQINRIESVDHIFNRQFPEDAGPLSHSIRLKSYIEVDNFYTSTVYEKSAEVARMLITIFGRETFKKIIKNFMSEFDGKPAIISDFIKSAADITNTDLSQFELWYDQAGTPELEIKTSYAKNGDYTLKIKQHNNKNTENFYIPFSFSLIDNKGKELTSETVIINKQEHIFKYKAQKTPVTPSLLRNFSAPVIINHTYTNEELLFLITNDSDPINRWNSSRKLFINVTNDLCKIIATKKPYNLPKTLLNMFKNIISDKKIDPALAAQILQFPNINYLLENTSNIEIENIYLARNFIKKGLASNLEKEFTNCYNANNIIKPYKLTSSSIGKRSIKNLALYYLMHLEKPDMYATCLKQLKTSDNLTDTLSSLNAIANSNYEKKEDILERYYEKWEHHPNLVNKWLSINANIETQGNLKRIQSLLNHPGFNIKTPNKVYSLIHSFCKNNLINFHAKDGSGYEFLSKQITAIDKLNPPVAAILASSFTHGKNLDKKRQHLLQIEVNKLKSNNSLSKNVHEIIGKISYL